MILSSYPYYAGVSPPGLHRPCHSLPIPTNVWGAQDDNTGDTCVLHSNTNKTLYPPLSTIPEYSMPCQRKKKGQNQTHLGRVQWKRGNIIFSPVHISLQLSSVAVVSPVCTILLRLFPWVSPPPRSSRILHGAAFAASSGCTSSVDLLFFLVPGGYDLFPLPAILPFATAPYRPSSLHESIRLC